MNTVITLAHIEAAIADINGSRQSRMRDLFDETQIEPTWDGKRYHSPCDNYIFDDISYAAGQYLHDPLEDSGRKPVRGKVLVMGGIKEEFRCLMKSTGSDVSFGKSWTKDEVELCYAYIEGPRHILKCITEMVPGSTKTLCEANGEHELGKTWQTTLGKLSQKLYHVSVDGLMPAVDDLYVDDDLDRKIVDWILAKKKKTTKVTVGYKYETAVVGA